MAEDKKQKMEKLSFVGSDYFMVQLPDGSMEKRPKKAMNVDPGVHSVLYLDQLAQSFEPQQPPPNLPPISSTVDILPPISESNNTTTPTEGGEKNQQAKSVPNGPDDTRPRSIQKHMSHADYLQTSANAREGATSVKSTEASGGAFRHGTRTRYNSILSLTTTRNYS
jgi:hypothetical protein